jgi:hypothetical protein
MREGQLFNMEGEVFHSGLEWMSGRTVSSCPGPWRPTYLSMDMGSLPSTRLVSPALRDSHCMMCCTACRYLGAATGSQFVSRN